MSIVGAGSLELSLESGDAQQLNIGGFDIDMSDTPEAGFTLNLELVSVTEGSVGFTGWISGVPGMEEANLDVAGNIHSNGAFRVSSSAQDLIFAGFEINSAVAVANYDIAAEDDEDVGLVPGDLLPLDRSKIRSTCGSTSTAVCPMSCSVPALRRRGRLEPSSAQAHWNCLSNRVAMMTQFSYNIGLAFDIPT